MSIFSQWAARVFDQINILYARGFKVIKPAGDVAWGVNQRGYMAVGRETASYPVHVVTPAGSSLGVVVTDNSNFFVQVGWHNSYGVAMVQASGRGLALGLNGTPMLHLTNSYGMGVMTQDPSAVQAARLPGFTVNLDRGASRADQVVRGNPANLNLVNTAGPTGAKWVQFNVTATGLARFRALNDDNTAATAENILTMALDTGNVGIATNSASGPLDVNGARLRLRTAVTPASSTAAANQGEIFWGNSGLYVAIGTNSLKRLIFDTWP